VIAVRCQVRGVCEVRLTPTPMPFKDDSDSAPGHVMPRVTRCRRRVDLRVTRAVGQSRRRAGRLSALRALALPVGAPKHRALEIESTRYSVAADRECRE